MSNTTHASTSLVLPQNASHYPYTNDPKMLQNFTPLPEQLVPPTLHFTTLTISRSYAMSPSTPTSSKKNTTSIVPSTTSAPAMASSTTSHTDLANLTSLASSPPTANHPTSPSNMSNHALLKSMSTKSTSGRHISHTHRCRRPPGTSPYTGGTSARGFGPRRAHIHHPQGPGRCPTGPDQCKPCKPHCIPNCDSPGVGC